jgi:PAS domain S-box-containing protein
MSAAPSPFADHRHVGRFLVMPTGVLWVLLWALITFMLGQVGRWYGVWFGTMPGPIDPAAGFALAVVIHGGFERGLAAVYIGSSLTLAVSGASAFAASAGALVLAAGALAGAWFFQAAGGSRSLSRLRDVLKLLTAAVLVLPAAQALGGLAVGLVGPQPFSGQTLLKLLAVGQASAFGAAVFAPFSLLAFRRQDFRPGNSRGAYELLFYSALLALFVHGLLTDRAMDAPLRLLAGALCLGLSILVALRFGVRSAVLFQAMFVFLIPAFVVMFPGRISRLSVVDMAGDAANPPTIATFLLCLACLLIAAFRDEVVGLQVRLNLAMAAADLGLWEWSPVGWRFHSRLWAEKFGHPAGRLVNGTEIRDRIHPDDVEELQAKFRTLLENPEGACAHNFRQKDAQGDWRLVNCHARLFRRRADDAPETVLGISRDITDERHAEQARLDAVEKEAELQTLRSQLNPHFLFNSLNSVRALIGRDDDRAKQMVTSLSKLLRDLLSSRSDTVHTVAKEFEIVRNYLAVEAIRFGTRLRFALSCDPTVEDRPMPGMLLQTLVENAVKHGISRSETGGLVEIFAGPDEAGSGLILRVVNDGTLAPAGEPALGTGGYGLSNTRRRINLATSGTGHLEIRELPGPRVESVVLLPEPLAATQAANPP